MLYVIVQSCNVSNPLRQSYSASVRLHESRTAIAKMTVKKRAFRTLAAVILLGMIGAAALYWRLASAKVVADLDGVATENVWNAPYAGGNYTCKRRRAKSLTFRGPSFGASLSPEGGTLHRGEQPRVEPSIQHRRQ